MEINRIWLEKVTTSLAVLLLTFLAFVLTLAVSNTVFKWDLFPPSVEKAGLVFIIAVFLIIVASVIINIMVNIGRIADTVEKEHRKS